MHDHVLMNTPLKINTSTDAMLSVQQTVYGDFSPGPAHHLTRNSI
jgi:hypothetical protein